MPVAYSIIQKSQLEGAHRLDAEYYQPEYLESKSALEQLSTNRLIDVAKVSDGNHGSISESFSATDGVRYLRGKDLNNFFVSDDDSIYIPENEYLKIKRSHIFKNDVLVSIVGTIGLVSIVADDFDKLTGNCKIAILRTKKIDPWFLSAFLISRYGQDQLHRKVAGAVQTGIILKDLSVIQIPDVAESEQKKVREVVEESYREQVISENLYSQAEDLLLEELGLKSFEVEDDLSYIVNLSEIKSAHRSDAEYFQPKYERILEKIKKHNARKIGDLAKLVGHAAQSPYDEVGEIAVLAQTHMKRNLEIDTSAFDNYTIENLIKKNDKKFMLKKDDVLISSAGEPGLASVWTGDYEGRVIPGSFVTVVRFKKEVEPLYVGVFLNVSAGKLQFERDYTGSVQQYVYPTKIKQIMIPILPRSTQQKIADLIQKSHETRSKAKQLLVQAKSKVEKIIETGSR